MCHCHLSNRFISDILYYFPKVGKVSWYKAALPFAPHTLNSPLLLTATQATSPRLDSFATGTALLSRPSSCDSSRSQKFVKTSRGVGHSQLGQQSRFFLSEKMCAEEGVGIAECVREEMSTCFDEVQDRCHLVIVGESEAVFKHSVSPFAFPSSPMERIISSNVSKTSQGDSRLGARTLHPSSRPA